MLKILILVLSVQDIFLLLFYLSVNCGCDYCQKDSAGMLRQSFGCWFIFFFLRYRRPVWVILLSVIKLIILRFLKPHPAVGLCFVCCLQWLFLSWLWCKFIDSTNIYWYFFVKELICGFEHVPSDCDPYCCAPSWDMISKGVLTAPDWLVCSLVLSADNTEVCLF